MATIATLRRKLVHHCHGSYHLDWQRRRVTAVVRQAALIVWNDQCQESRRLFSTRAVAVPIWGCMAKQPFSTKPSSSSSASALKWWHPVVGGCLAVTLYSVQWFHEHIGGTEGLFRSLSFYSTAIPRYILYRYHLFMNSPDDVWDQVHRETSQVALEKILELEGFYYKAGQMCASNLGNAFPEIWRDTMSVLQDQVPPQPFEVIKKTVQSEMDMDKVFRSFEETPIGSASIGQVHRAVLWDGTKVVVKVCYPNAERLLRGDVRTIKAFASLAQPVHVPALAEIEKQFATEFDYRLEAHNMAAVRQNLQQAGLCGPQQKCIVPRPYLEYTTKRVLVMEELHGTKLEVALKRDFHSHYVGKAHIEEYLKNYKENGPTAREYEQWIAVADSQRRLTNAWNRLYNWTAGVIRPSGRRSYSDRTGLPLNHAQLVDDLIWIHGHEVLVDGLYNGDCHPGNILLCRKPKTGDPQLGLIDYGQIKSLTKEQRHMFARFIIATADDDRDEMCRLMMEMGYRSKNMDRDVMYRYAKVGFDEESRSLTNGLHVQLFMEELQRLDPIITLPTNYVMVSRCSLLLRGLAHALHQPRRIAVAWKPIAERVLKEDL